MPLAVGDSAHFNDQAIVDKTFATPTRVDGINSNSPMTVTALGDIDAVWGQMVTVSRQNVIVGTYPEQLLIQVPTPVEMPPPVFPPDAVP